MCAGLFPHDGLFIGHCHMLGASDATEANASRRAARPTSHQNWIAVAWCSTPIQQTTFGNTGSIHHAVGGTPQGIPEYPPDTPPGYPRGARGPRGLRETTTGPPGDNRGAVWGHRGTASGWFYIWNQFKTSPTSTHITSPNHPKSMEIQPLCAACALCALCSAHTCAARHCLATVVKRKRLRGGDIGAVVGAAWLV